MKLVKSKQNFAPATFGNLWDNFFLDDHFYGSKQQPAVNVAESGEAFLIEVSAPGYDKKDFKLELDNHVLNIWVEKTTSQEQSDIKFTRKEFSYGKFSRSFRLPETIDTQKIEAKYDNGILRVALPKIDAAKAQPIQYIKIK